MRLVITALLGLILFFNFYVVVDENALKIYNDTFNRAVYSFALVKGLNALISVLQSTEINVSVFVGATVGVGEVLDPINDLVERFSVVMLFSSISIGLQHLLLILGKSMFVQIALSLSVILVALSLWVKKLQITQMINLSFKLVFLFLLLRFGAVVFIYSTQFLYDNIYATQYQEASLYLHTYKGELEELKENKEEFSTLWESLKSKTETFSKKVIELIIIFVVTTIVFPLLFIWLSIVLLRLIFNIKLDYDTLLGNINLKGR